MDFNSKKAGYRRIYLISNDDSYIAFMQDLFEKFASEDHFQAEKSVPSALEFLKRGAVDIILFDLTIPSEAKGLDIFFSLRSIARGVPIVAVSGCEDEDLIMKVIGFGAQDGLLKTNKNKEDILQVIRHTLQRVKAHQDYCENLLLDELTSLNNRKGFVNLSEQQLRLTNRSKKSLVFLNFKVTNLNKINQSFDYKEGNRALVQTAEILKASFRKTDILARYKGDELAVCAIDALKASIELMAKRFLVNLKFYNDNMPDAYKIQVRVGAITVGPDNILSVEDIVQLAGENTVK